MVNARSASDLQKEYRFICDQLWSFEDPFSSTDDAWEGHLERGEKLRENLELLLSRSNPGEAWDCGDTDSAVMDISMEQDLEQCELFEESLNESAFEDQRDKFDRLSKEVGRCLHEITVRKALLLDTSVDLFREFEGLVNRVDNRESEEVPMIFVATVVGAIIGWVVSG